MRTLRVSLAVAAAKIPEVEELAKGITEWLHDNPAVRHEFVHAWCDGNGKHIASLLEDYASELESAPVNQPGAFDHRGRP